MEAKAFVYNPNIPFDPSVYREGYPTQAEQERNRVRRRLNVEKKIRLNVRRQNRIAEQMRPKTSKGSVINRNRAASVASDPRSRVDSYANSIASDPRGQSIISPTSSVVNLSKLIGINNSHSSHNSRLNALQQSRKPNNNLESVSAVETQYNNNNNIANLNSNNQGENFNENLSGFENASPYAGKINESSKKTNLSWGNYFGRFKETELQSNFTIEQVKKYIGLPYLSGPGYARLQAVKNIFNRYGIEPLVQAYDGREVFYNETSPSIIEFLIQSGYPTYRPIEYVTVINKRLFTPAAIKALSRFNNSINITEIVAAYFMYTPYKFRLREPVSEYFSSKDFAKDLAYLFSLFNWKIIMEGLALNDMEMFSFIRSLSTLHYTTDPSAWINLFAKEGYYPVFKRQNFLNIIKVLIENGYPIDGLSLIRLYEPKPNLSEFTGPNTSELVSIIDLMANAGKQLSKYYDINGRSVSPITAAIRPNYFPVFKKLLEVGVPVDDFLIDMITHLAETNSLPEGFNWKDVIDALSMSPEYSRLMFLRRKGGQKKTRRHAASPPRHTRRHTKRR